MSDLNNQSGKKEAGEAARKRERVEEGKIGHSGWSWFEKGDGRERERERKRRKREKLFRELGRRTTEED